MNDVWHGILAIFIVFPPGWFQLHSIHITEKPSIEVAPTTQRKELVKQSTRPQQDLKLLTVMSKTSFGSYRHTNP